MSNTPEQIESLDGIKTAMGKLYAEVRDGTTELKTAAELANIAGKYLKAEQLQLAREIFMGQLGKKPEAISAQLTQTA